MTHCHLLPHVTDLLPGEVLFSKGFLKQVIATKIVWSVMFLDHQCAMYLGLVITFEMYVLKMILTSIVYIVSIGEMNNKINGKWSESVSDEDKRVGMQVLELCIERDSLNEWVFDREESLIL